MASLFVVKYLTAGACIDGEKGLKAGYSNYWPIETDPWSGFGQIHGDIQNVEIASLVDIWYAFSQIGGDAGPSRSMLFTPNPSMPTTNALLARGFSVKLVLVCRRDLDQRDKAALDHAKKLAVDGVKELGEFLVNPTEMMRRMRQLRRDFHPNGVKD